MLEVEAILQFLASGKKDINGREVYFGRFSDGFYEDEFAFSPNPQREFEQSVKEFNIFRIRFYLYNFKDFSHLLIHEVELVFTNLEKAIGDPVKFVPNSVTLTPLAPVGARDICIPASSTFPAVLSRIPLLKPSTPSRRSSLSCARAKSPMRN